MEAIKLNLVPSDLTKPICHASQFDDGREIMLMLYDGQMPYVLSDEEIELDVKKLDGNIVTTDLTVESGKNYVIMVTTEQMCAIAGRNNCELKVQKDGKTIYSKNFYLAVEESATAGGIQSASEINNLESQIAGMVEDAVENQYDSENVIFDSEPTEGHGSGYTVTSEGIKAAIDAAGGGGVSPDVITDEYDATSTYAIGDMVIHENALYVCSAAITTAEAWNSAHWTLTDIATAIGTVKTAIPTKTSDLQNDSGFAQIDDTTESASKTYSSEKIEGELDTKASANWKKQEVFNGTYEHWRRASNDTLTYDDNSDSAVIPLVNGGSYHIVATGDFNRFILVTANEVKQDGACTMVIATANPSSPSEYTFVNSSNAKYLVITLNYNDANFDCDLSVVETVTNGQVDFKVNGVDVLLTERLNSYLAEITDNNYIIDKAYENTNNSMNHGEISNNQGKLAICPMVNGLKYIIDISGKINRFVVAVANGNTTGTAYTIVYNSGISTEAQRTLHEEYTNTSNYKYLLVFYYYGTPSETISLNIQELSYNGKMTVSGFEVALKDELPLLFDNYMSDLSVDSVANASALYTLYDKLITEYPDYISKNVLGQDSVGNNIIEIVLTTPNYNSQTGGRTEDTEISKPKVLIVTGVHGYERSSVMSTYQFVRDLCEYNPKLANLRENYLIKVIPCVCPSSFNADTRTNTNGVNINRNFEDNWTLTSVGDNYSGASASDQLETQIVEDWIDTNNDAILYVDFHNSGFDNEVSYIQGNNNYTGMSTIKANYLKALYKTSDYWKKIENFATTLIFAYTGNQDAIASSNCYADITGQLLSILLETSWNQNDSGKHSKLTIKTGAEALGNMLIGILGGL